MTGLLNLGKIVGKYAIFFVMVLVVYLGHGIFSPGTYQFFFFFFLPN